MASDPAKHLLHLMTGAWTTSAIAVAAELQLADHLASGPVSAERLAELTGTDRDSLGAQLRTDADGSMHPLAIMYGGPFYQSFGAVLHTVRTGEEAFAHVFGKNHFDYFADHPPLAALFDRAMAASATLFAPVASLADFTGARTVIDIAGGKRCASAMPPHATLLIIERLLPSALAHPWDLHMMCNVGGRERTLDQYRTLLTDAGFTLTATHDLPLDFTLLDFKLP